MKRIITIIFISLISVNLFAQVPEKMSYQAVIRDATGSLIVNQQVGMQISILQGSASGTAAYVETQIPTTNANGLISIDIGSGNLESGSFATIDWANGPYFIKTETDPAGGTNYTLTGTSQLLSVPYALHAKTAESVTGTITESDPVYSQSVASKITATDTTNWNNATQSLSTTANKISISNGNSITLPDGLTNVPIYTTSEILALTPENGQALYNSTEHLYQIYQGSAWKSFSANCWPQPTVPYAGSAQTFTDGTVSATLAANMPAAGHGTGLWSIVSGIGGSITDATNPVTTFTGTACTAYILQWTISTSCYGSSSNVNITFNQTPTIANAGPDQTFNDGTVSATLAANTPEALHGTGAWTIVSGTGGSFTDATDPATTFTGNLREAYTLRWSITTNCSSSFDDVVILFAQDEAGSILTDIDGNSYNTVYIGSQLWMAENLKVTQAAGGTAIPLVTDNTAWGNLGDNDTDKAYCYYSNSIDSLAKYGALYTYAAAKDACPAGWHLPTDAEWTILETYITNDGHSGTEGTALKTTTGWNSGNGTDDYNFSALPGGSRYYYDGSFDWLGNWGYWWSTTEYDSDQAYHFLVSFGTDVGLGPQYKSRGYSVRCVRD